MLQFPLLLAFVRGWVGLGGTLKPSSCLLPCSGGFPAPPIPWLLFPPSLLPAGISPQRGTEGAQCIPAPIPQPRM